MAKWLAKEFDWDTGRYTGRYYDIAEPGIVAVFVDSFYGDDASADPEDPDLPLKTLGAAITYLNTNGANGSRIFMNGVFSENLPAQTYWYEFIGCGGGWDGKTIFLCNISSYIVIKLRGDSRYHNFRTVNYTNSDINNTFDLTAFNQYNYYIVNSVITNCDYGSQNLDTNFNVYVYNSRFYKSRYHGRTQWTPQWRIRGTGNIFYECWIASLERRISLLAPNNSVYNAEPSSGAHPNGYLRLSDNVVNSSTNNLIGVIPQYISADGLDFNVRITSPLLGAGAVDEITGIAANVGGVQVGLPYNGISPEFTTEGGATITDLTIDTSGKFIITAPATTGTLETALMDLGNIYPLENIDLFNVFDFAAGEITQGVFEDFVSPRMALTIKLKYGLTSAEVDSCPWLLIEYGKQPTFSGTGASRVGNAADTFDPDTFQTITCRYMKLFVTLQNNS